MKAANRKKKKLNKVFLPIIASLLVVVILGGAFFVYRNTALAKETLLAIEEMRNSLIESEQEAFEILEIVPAQGVAKYTNPVTNALEDGYQVTTPYTVDGKENTNEGGVKTDRTILLSNTENRKDANYSFGTVGFYIKGQEPLFLDWVRVLSDAEEGPSLLTDSVARKRFAGGIWAGGMLDKISILTSDDESANAPFYNGPVGGYHELRWGETINADVNGDGVVEKVATEELLKSLVADYGYYEIAHEYTGAVEKKYIDHAEGVMRRATEKGSANYALTYLPDYATTPVVINGVEMKVLDQTKDPSYLMATTPSESVSPEVASLFTISDRAGVYDPNLLCVSIADASRYGALDAGYRATFAYAMDAKTGYVPQANHLVDAEYLATPEGQDKVTKGMPLYVYDTIREVYLFAGFYDSVEDGHVKLEDISGDAKKHQLVNLFYPETENAELDIIRDGNDIPLYYMVEFEYQTNPSSLAKAYQVSYYDTGATDGTGVQYAVNYTEEGAIVPNFYGKGVIDAINTTEEHFLFDYQPETGLFQWTSDLWLTGELSSSMKLYRIRGAKMHFTGGVINRDVMRRDVFDMEPEECSKLRIHVKTIAASEVTDKDINTTNMVVFHGGLPTFSYGYTEGDLPVEEMSYKKNERDISLDVVKAIVGRVVNEGMPVVSQHNVMLSMYDAGQRKQVRVEPNVYDADQDHLPEDIPNAYYLTRALTLENMEGYYKEVLTDNAVFVSPLKYGDAITLGNEPNRNAHHVNKSVYNASFNNWHPAYGLFNVDFKKQKDSIDGYEDVLLSIQAENVYRVASKLQGRLEETISDATIYRYIIAYAFSQNYENNGSLRILEIAPFSSFTLRLEVTREEEELKSTLYKITEKNANGEVLKKEALFTVGDAEITLTQMTSSEFIGHVEDINAHYDLIYIGADIGPYMTEYGKTFRMYKNSSGETAYNDTNMDGLIYSNIGDEIYINQMGLYTASETTRFSGNDITQEKQRALEEFINAGFPVIVADELVYLDTEREQEPDKRKPLAVNAHTVDNSSYMYQMLDDVKDYENFFRLSEVTSPLLNMYFNLSRPRIILAEDSPAARSVEEAQRLATYRDGYCRAVYEFKVEGTGRGGSDATYDFELFIDINADGKFSKTTEKIQQLELTDTAGNPVPRDEDGRYQMEADTYYRATYVISSSQRGVLPWKMRVTRNDGINLKRADAIGYYEIRDPDGKLEKVKVLQINTESGGNSTWNMEETLADEATHFSQLLSNHDVVPFDVSIDTIASDQFNIEEVARRHAADRLCVDAVLEDSNHNGSLDVEEFLEFYRNYDMLVIGFADVIRCPSENTILAVKAYVEEGRSVLFTHDTTSPYMLPGIGYSNAYNRILRDTFGMDRYNATGQRVMSDDETFDLDRPYVPKSGREEVLYHQDNGATYTTLIRKSPRVTSEGGYSRQKVLFENFEGMKADNSHDANVAEWVNYYTMEVDVVNSGQITTYPYKLDSGQIPGQFYTFSTSATHGQYYQLDFTKDVDKDGESDLVVWYTLTGRDLYQFSPRDVRNNYYIYNMGNVTYSGVGHSSVMGDDKIGGQNLNEIKLFVNTLIASYESGLHAPTVRIIENYNVNSRDQNSIYVSYDEQLEMIDNAKVTNGVIDQVESIYFVTDTTSLIRNEIGKTHTFEAQLYMEVPNLQGAEEVVYKGETTYGRKIAIKGLYSQNPDGTEVEILPQANGTYLVTPGTVYRAEVPMSALKYYNDGKNVFDETDVPLGDNPAKNARNAKDLFVTVTEKIRVNSSGTETSATAIDGVSLVRVKMFDLD